MTHVAHRVCSIFAGVTRTQTPSGVRVFVYVRAHVCVRVSVDGRAVVWVRASVSLVIGCSTCCRRPLPGMH